MLISRIWWRIRKQWHTINVISYNDLYILQSQQPLVSEKVEYNLVCRTSQDHGHIVEHVLHNQEALGHAKAPEGGVGGQVGPAGDSAASRVRDVVGVVHVKENFLCYLREEEIRFYCGLKVQTFVTFTFTLFSFYLPEQIHPQRCQHWRSTGRLQPEFFRRSWNPPDTNRNQLSGLHHVTATLWISTISLTI